MWVLVLNINIKMKINHKIFITNNYNKKISRKIEYEDKDRNE